MPTILITGCSTGFGRETALLFLENGWNVIATMRNPDDNTLPESDRLRVLPLDITDANSIADAIAAAGTIDVLVNNAGIGWLNAIEGTSMERVRRVFETNTFGTIAMMRAVLPGMRESGSGTIVNVSSSVTLRPMPLLSVYRGSKAAVNAISEAVAKEVAPFGIRVRTVLPGQSRQTAFTSGAMERIESEGGFAVPYLPMVDELLGVFANLDPAETTHPRDVANAVWRAATEDDCPATIPAGADAIVWANAA